MIDPNRIDDIPAWKFYGGLALSFVVTLAVIWLTHMATSQKAIAPNTKPSGWTQNHEQHP